MALTKINEEGLPPIEVPYIHFPFVYNLYHIEDYDEDDEDFSNSEDHFDEEIRRMDLDQEILLNNFMLKVDENHVGKALQFEMM